MATSLRDLLDAADDELAALARAGNNAAAASGAGAALGATARSLRVLADAGVGGTGRRALAVSELAAACAALTEERPGPCVSRAADLVGAAGDVIGQSCREFAPEDRWAVGLRLAATVRRAAGTWRACGPELPVSSIERARRIGVQTARLGVVDTPDLRRTPLWDRPLPRPFLPAGLPVSTVAVESALRLAALLHHANHVHPGDGLALHSLRAACLAAGAAARYGDAIAATACRSLAPPAAAAPAWLEARALFAVLHDGQHVPRGYPVPLLTTAARLHEALRRDFGAPDTVRTVDVRQVTELRAVIAQLPVIARELGTALHRLDRRAVAQARDLPQRLDRVEQWLRRQPVVIDGRDLHGLDVTLRTAGSRSAAVATRLGGLEGHEPRLVLPPALSLSLAPERARM